MWRLLKGSVNSVVRALPEAPAPSNQINRAVPSSASRPTPPGISYELFIVSFRPCALGKVPVVVMTLHLNLILDVHQGFLWGGVAVATIFLSGRLFSRLRALQRIFVDDLLITLAYVLLVVSSALWQWGAKYMYQVLDANAGIIADGVNVFRSMRLFLRVSFATELMFYIILLLFKLSLLFFFKRLSGHLDYFRYYWWIVLILSAITFVVAIGNVDYRCLLNPLDDIVVHCNSNSGTHFLTITLVVNCALDVLTDFLSKLFPCPPRMFHDEWLRD